MMKDGTTGNAHRPENPPIKALFLDIGGVLLTNGWDRHARQRAAETFGLDLDSLEERHHLSFDTYEEGKLTLDEYLTRIVFYEARPFTRQQFKDFLYAQTQPFTDMIQLIKEIKGRYGLKVVTISNEGRELTIYRIQQFQLGEFVDFFVSSCFVHFRKPDADIYRIALDGAQIPESEAIYIDDRDLFVEVARSLGLNGILHRDLASTRAALESFGLAVSSGEKSAGLPQSID